MYVWQKKMEKSDNYKKITAKKFARRKVAIVTVSTHWLLHHPTSRFRGASVVVSSRKQKNADEAVEKLKGRGIQVLGVVCHVSNAQHRKNLINKTLQIDVLVSNAAVNPSASTPWADNITRTQESILDKLWEVFATELVPNIRVNCVAPGLCQHAFQMKFLLNRIMLKRLGTTEEIAAAVTFLASEDASYITGETLVVAGGIPSRL